MRLEDFREAALMDHDKQGFEHTSKNYPIVVARGPGGHEYSNFILV